MANIQERKGKGGKTVYRVRVRIDGFALRTKTFNRKTDAKEWAAKTESDMKSGRDFPTRKVEKRTLAELVDRYVREVCPTKKDGDKQARQLGWWKDQIGHCFISDLTPEVLAGAREKLASEVLPERKAEGTKRRVRGQQPRLRSGATVNRYLAALSHPLTIASKEWGWLTENPLRRVSKRKEGRGRVRFLDGREVERLLNACKAGPSYLYPVAVLALRTGMRQGEVLGLRWRDIDLARRRLVLQDTKSGDRRGVPLDDAAVEVLRGLARVRILDDDTVFTGTGSFRRAFAVAVKRARVDDFRFHDLRHTAASQLAMSGCSPSEIAGILGHKTLAMVKRYAHLADDHLDEVVRRKAEKFPLTLGSRDAATNAAD